MQIVMNEKDLRGLTDSTLNNLYGIFTDIIRKSGPCFTEEDAPYPGPTRTEPMRVIKPESELEQEKEETPAEAPAKRRKRATKPEVDVKPDPAPEIDPEVEDEDTGEMELGDALEDEPEEEKPAPKPQRTRKELFAALQSFCKSDKANAKKVREAIKELGIAKVSAMSDEQMTEICEDMGI